MSMFTVEGYCVCADVVCVLCNLQTFMKIQTYISAACMLYGVVTKSPADVLS